MTDKIDEAIAKATDPIPTFDANVELHDARPAFIRVPQDFDARDFHRLVLVLSKLLDVADNARAQKANSGLVVPDRRIVRPQ